MHRSTAIASGVGAGLLWGLAFLVPEVLSGVSAVELTAGRYLVYGSLSAAVLLAAGRARRPRLDRAAWGTAVTYAMAGNVGYYLLVAVAVQQVGAPVAAMIVGALPVSGAIHAARVHGTRVPWVPVALCVAGLVLVTLPALGGESPRGLAGALAGVAAALAALAAWTWYAAANAAFLRRRPELSPASWSTVVGTATLALTAAPLAVAALAGAARAPGVAARPAAFLAGAVVLGVLASWMATVLWNAASSALPVHLATQLVVVETVAGTSYSFGWRGALPDPVTVAGCGLLVCGVVLALRGRGTEGADARGGGRRGGAVLAGAPER